MAVIVDDESKIKFRNKVRIMGNHLKKLTDEQIDMYLEDSEEELEIYIPVSSQERALRNLVCHFATLNKRRVTEEKISDMQKKYGNSKSLKDGGFDSTEYGQEYLRISDKYKPKKVAIRMVSRK